MKLIPINVKTNDVVMTPLQICTDIVNQKVL